MRKLMIGLALTLSVGGAALYRPDLDPGPLEARYATTPSRFVTVGGLRHHVRDRGQGDVIVLLHGQSANLRVWDAWAEDLARDHRVISIDLPGHGLTGPDPQGRYDWTQLAANLNPLLAELGVDRFVLVGNSLGGAIGVEYAAANPDRLRGLVLIAPIGAPRREPKPLMFELYATPVIGPAIINLTPGWLVRDSLRSTYGDPGRLKDGEETAFAALMRRRGNREAARRIVSQPGDPRFADKARSVKTPTLILWGANDTWVRPEYGAWFEATLPDARRDTFAGVGHMPMQEAPGPTVEALRRFLTALDSRR